MVRIWADRTKGIAPRDQNNLMSRSHPVTSTLTLKLSVDSCAPSNRGAS